MMKFRGLLLSFLVLGVLLLGSSCKKTKSQSVSESSFLSPYYLTESTIISISHEVDAGFSGNVMFVQTYFESESYLKAHREQCVPQSGDEGDTRYSFLPFDEQGEVLTPENRLVVLNENGEATKTYDLNKECGISDSCRRMRCCGDGCWVLSRRADALLGVKEYDLDLIHPEDGLKKHILLDMNPAEAIILDLVVYDDNRIALSVWEQKAKLILIDEAGYIEKEIDLPERIESNVVYFKGQWTCVGCDEQGDTILFSYEEKNHRWAETHIELPIYRTIMVRGENLFGINSTGISQINMKQPMTLLWEDASVWGTIQDIRILENGEFDIVARPVSEDLFVKYHLSPAEKKDLQEKEEFVIAGYDLENSCLNQLVQEMCLRHPDIKFVLRDYKNEINSTEENWAQAKKEISTIMSLDLANGTAPDMYYDLYDDFGLSEWGRLGYLKDLTPVVAKFNNEDYFVDKITLGEETPYCACLYFDVIGFCASEKYVQNPYTWTYEDFYRSAENYDDLSGIQSIFSKQYLLKHAVMAQADKYIKDGKAYFTGEAFLKLLKWTNDIGCKSNWDNYVFPDLDNGYYMLDWADIVSLGSVIQYQNHVIVGFPNEDGALHVVPYCLLAVSATTSKTELAYEIIGYSLGEEFQSKNYQLQSGISVNRKCCERRMEKDYETFVEIDPHNLRFSKEEYFEMFMSLIRRADRYLHGSQAIVDICLDEAEAYYSGDISAEHAAELIQNRVDLYLQETK